MTNIVLLDGGMGQELIARSKFPPSPMWSAKVMMDEPEIVEAVHRDYLDAGATVITLNSYSATPERLARDASIDLFEPLQAKAIDIAVKAISQHDAAIAGCLPPLFGSYHPEMAPTMDRCLQLYRQIVAEQADHVDVFLCETLSSVREVTAATKAGKESGKPVWTAMSVDDHDGTRLRSGELLAEGVAAAKDSGASAILVNCSWPEAVTTAMPILALANLPFGGYANGFTAISDLKLGGTVDVLRAREDLGPEAYADHAMQWVNAGATIVGGCCEVGPAHIKTLKARLLANGHDIINPVRPN